MKISASNKAMALSFLRVFVAAAGTAYLALGKSPLDLGMDDLRTVGNAAIGALLLTIFNYVRQGETRFGIGKRRIARDDHGRFVALVKADKEQPEPSLDARRTARLRRKGPNVDAQGDLIKQNPVNQ